MSHKFSLFGYRLTMVVSKLEVFLILLICHRSTFRMILKHHWEFLTSGQTTRAFLTELHSEIGCFSNFQFSGLKDDDEIPAAISDFHSFVHTQTFLLIKNYLNISEDTHYQNMFTGRICYHLSDISFSFLFYLIIFKDSINYIFQTFCMFIYLISEVILRYILIESCMEYFSFYIDINTFYIYIIHCQV